MDNMKYINTLTGLFLLALMTMSAAACDNRDPQAEYEALSAAVYPYPRNGIDAAQEYIDHFYKKGGARINEVSDIRHQYRLMADFFAETYSDYGHFLRESKTLDRELSGSVYEGVRNTWKNLYARERDRLLAPLMEQITEEAFDKYFQYQIRSFCEERYQTWGRESTDRLGLNTPRIKADGTTKECQGRYRVHLRGKIIGIRTSTADVENSGEIGVDAQGRYTYRLVSYNFSNEPIL